MVVAVLTFWRVAVLNKCIGILVGLILEFRSSSVSPFWSTVVLHVSSFLLSPFWICRWFDQ